MRIAWNMGEGIKENNKRVYFFLQSPLPVFNPAMRD